MKKLIKFGSSSVGALWYFLVVIVLPATTLLVGGVIYLWQKNLFLVTVIVWLLVSAIAYVALIYWPERKAARSAATENDTLPDVPEESERQELPNRIKTQSYWTTRDVAIWDRSCLAIESKLEEHPDWEALPVVALHQLALIANEYHTGAKNAQYNFTIPELLLVVSVSSARYRQLVIDYVPYIDKFTVANANTIFDQKANINTGYVWFNRIRRTARLINPASAVVGELRDLITDKIFSQASNTLQNDLKRLLLQEVTQVGIDLYSGKLSASTSELAGYTSNAAKQDHHRLADAVEPLRVLLLGQTSVGKSSLINALTDTLQAEIGSLPVTNRLIVHELSLEDEALMSLIDSPGIDGTTDMQVQLTEAALDADLIVWLAKATQPARAPDNELHKKLLEHYLTHPEKIPAPIIVALTHVDQLSPKAEWDPPYDLDSEQAKAVSIGAALNSAKERIGLPDSTLAIPVYLGEEYEHYNIDSLASQLMLLVEKSSNVQLNRRRIELGSASKDWRSHWTQAKRLGKVIGKSVVKGV